MTDQRQLIDDQIAYYRARASEYDDWWFRQGRYDRGDEQRRAWSAEIAHLETALDGPVPSDTCSNLRVEPASGRSASLDRPLR